MKRGSNVANVALIVVLLVSFFANTGFAWGTKSCTVHHNYQGTINATQDNDTGSYFYVIVINAHYGGKWGVQVSVQGYPGFDNTFDFTNPTAQLAKGVQVAPGVTVRTGRMSGIDERIAVDYKAGTCWEYSLNALYSRY